MIKRHMLSLHKMMTKKLPNKKQINKFKDIKFHSLLEMHWDNWVIIFINTNLEFHDSVKYR